MRLYRNLNFRSNRLGHTIVAAATATVQLQKEQMRISSDSFLRRREGKSININKRKRAKHNQ